jgi:hypothetical protein
MDSDHAALLEDVNYPGLVNAYAPREAVVCARHFENVRDRLLQLHPWVFARKETTPAQLSSPLSGWRYAYALPVDCLKVLSLIETPHHHHDPDHDHENHYHWHGRYHRSTGSMILRHWEQIGRNLCCNHKNIRLRYTAQVKNTQQWDPSFVDAFCVSLAIEIAPSVCGNAAQGMSMAQALVVRAQSAIVQAHQTGAVAGANELPSQETLWMDYSGVPTGFDDHGRFGY